MASTPLTLEERQYLLKLARATIERVAHQQDPPPPTPPTQRLQESGAAFVTLHTRTGDLRGCIGSLIAHRPLVEDVVHNAQSAAFEDPRFPPVTAQELDTLVVEVSILTAPEPLNFDDPDDLVQKLRPHVDGVLIQRGWNRATFLPQVWVQIPNVKSFLTQLCYKAGLPANAWQGSDLKVSTYQVEEFQETTPSKH